MLNRKQLPEFYKTDIKIDLNEFINHLNIKGLLNYNIYNDLHENKNTQYKAFLTGRIDNKKAFFTGDNEDPANSEQYKQLYLTKTSFDASSSIGSIQSVKDKMRSTNKSYVSYNPLLDETEYNVYNDLVNGPIKSLLNKFKSPLARVRFAVMKPGMIIKPHRDNDPSVICRYHLPIITNENVKFGVEMPDGINKEFVMPADGSVYFFNTGLKHWARNLGDSSRLHLIIDTNGQLDLKI